MSIQIHGYTTLPTASFVHSTQYVLWLHPAGTFSLCLCVGLLVPTRQNLRGLVLGIATDDALCTLPFLLRERPL